MKRLLGTGFHHNAHSPLRRAYFWFLRRFVGVFGKTQRVYFVDINGHRYKRVVFGDSAQAAQVEQSLQQFAGSGYFPSLIYRHENELLLDFIQGEAFDPADRVQLALLGDFFSDLYARNAVEIATDSSLLPQSLKTDLHFLRRSGVIDSSTEQRLQALGQRLPPDFIISGWDYVDPVSKNFLMIDSSAGDRRMAAIDVESLMPAVPLGSGLAKAQMHWLDDEGLAFLLERIQAPVRPLVEKQMHYVSLCFRAGWAKRKLLQGKRNFIQRARLSDFADKLQADSSNN